MDQLFGMEVFLQVAKTGSFSAAARTLKVSPSLVTKHIQSIEDHLDTHLFHRTTRRVALTDAGALLQTKWQKIFLDIEEAEASICSERLKMKGILRISTPTAFGRLKMVPLVAEFAKQHPDLVIELLFDNNLIDPIADGVDVVFKMAEVGNTEASNLIVRRIGFFDTQVCAAPSYLQAYGHPRCVDDLLNHNCLERTNLTSAGIKPWNFQGPEGLITITVSGTYRSNNSDALVAAAVEGYGLICKPKYMVDDHIAAGRLVPLTLDYPSASFPFYALWAAERRLSAKIRTFVDFSVANLPT